MLLEGVIEGVVTSECWGSSPALFSECFHFAAWACLIQAGTIFDGRTLASWNKFENGKKIDNTAFTSSFVTSALTAQASPYRFCQELTPFIAHNGGPCMCYQCFGWTITHILTAPVTRGDSGKACRGQVQCWPSVIFFRLICLSAIVWWGFPHVDYGDSPLPRYSYDWRTEN